MAALLPKNDFGPTYSGLGIGGLGDGGVPKCAAVFVSVATFARVAKLVGALANAPKPPPDDAVEVEVAIAVAKGDLAGAAAA
jgi:hypothetical protein